MRVSVDLILWIRLDFIERLTHFLYPCLFAWVGNIYIYENQSKNNVCYNKFKTRKTLSIPKWPQTFWDSKSIPYHFLRPSNMSSSFEWKHVYQSCICFLAAVFAMCKLLLSPYWKTSVFWIPPLWAQTDESLPVPSQDSWVDEVQFSSHVRWLLDFKLLCSLASFCWWKYITNLWLCLKKPCSNCC